MKRYVFGLFVVFWLLLLLWSKAYASECMANWFYNIWYSVKNQEIRVTRFGMWVEDVFIYSSLNFEKKKELNLDADIWHFFAYYENSWYNFDSVYDSWKYKKIVNDFKKDTINLQLIDLKKLDMQFSTEIIKIFDLNITKRDVDYYKDTKYETISYEMKIKWKLVDSWYLYESCNGKNCDSMMDEIPQIWDLKIWYGKNSTVIKNIDNCNNQNEYNIRWYSYPWEKFIVFIVTTIWICAHWDRTETIWMMKTDKELPKNVFISWSVKWRDIPWKYEDTFTMHSYFDKEINSITGIKAEDKCDYRVWYDISCIDSFVNTCQMLYKSQWWRLLKFDNFDYSQVLFYNNIWYQLYKQKAYDDAIQYRQFASNKNLYPLVTYNLAAVYAKMGGVKDAIVTLKKLLNSSKARWEYIPKIKSDKDFDKVRSDSEFKKLMSGWKKL